jgi:peroxiredoxin
MPRQNVHVLAAVVAAVVSACGASSKPPAAASSSAARSEESWRKMCGEAAARQTKCGDGGGDEILPADPAACEGARVCIGEVFRSEVLDAYSECRTGAECKPCKLGEGAGPSDAANRAVDDLMVNCKKSAAECPDLACTELEAGARPFRPDLVAQISGCLGSGDCAAKSSCVAERLTDPLMKLSACYGTGSDPALEQTVAAAKAGPKKLADFHIPLANGKGEASLAVFEGKKVRVLYLFPLDCKECPKTLARLQKLWTKEKKRLQILVVVMDAPRERVAALAKQAGAKLPVAVARERQVDAQFEAMGRPLMFIDAPSNQVAMVNSDPDGVVGMIEEALKSH